MSGTSIVWFKTDLRVEDNETLVKAIKHSTQIIPVYCIDLQQFQTSSNGNRKIGSFRAHFLFESLFNLQARLSALGSSLIVVTGKAEDTLPALVKQYDVTKVYAKREVAAEEKQEEERVRTALAHLRCDFECISTSTLYHAEDLPFNITHLPDLFTNFKKRVEKESSIRASFAAPERINSPILADFSLPNLSEFGYEEKKTDPRSAFPFKGGETEAMLRLKYYFSESRLVSTYKDTRNQLVGTDYSSKLSPWLALGCISPRYIHEQLLKYEENFGANDSTYWLRYELLWRDFFRFMFKKHGNRYFNVFGISSQNNFPKPFDATVFEAWKQGTTGDNFIDANMRELLVTGYMSNRGRQNVASYFCHRLQLDWRLGAAWFEEQLIDYDVCSNWGNWAYVAGVGNDARNREFNSEKQAAQYDTNGKYRNLWLSPSN